MLNEIQPELRPAFLTVSEMALNILPQPLRYNEETDLQFSVIENLFSEVNSQI